MQSGLSGFDLGRVGKSAGFVLEMGSGDGRVWSRPTSDINLAGCFF